MAQRVEEERCRSLTGKMLPGDGINEVRHSHCTKMIREYQIQCFLRIRHTHTHTRTHALTLLNILSYAPIIPTHHRVRTPFLLLTQIRAGPPRSTFMIARFKSIFLPRNTKNCVNMLKRRRKEWARAEKAASCWIYHFSVKCVYGMEWCGTGWCGVIWDGVVWNGVWCNVILCDDVVWCGISQDI